MDSTAHIRPRRRVRPALAGAAVVTVIAAGTAATPSASVAAVSGGTRPHTPLPAFLLDHGRYVTFDAPGAVAETGATAINKHGTIAGTYIDGNDAYRGFVRDRRGRFTKIDLPGAKSTQPSDINDRGQIVGTYSTVSGSPQDPDAEGSGFVSDRGRITRIRYPGSKMTQTTGINNRRQVVGQYVDRAGGFHGFRWENGRFTTVRVPGVEGTSPQNINDRGQIVGASIPDLDAENPTSSGFQLDRGRVATRDAPPGPFTIFLGNNRRGQIVGVSATGGVVEGSPLPELHGFLLAKGVKGAITPISVPGSPGSLVAGINDSGQIVGSYLNPDAPIPAEQTDWSVPLRHGGA